MEHPGFYKKAGPFSLLQLADAVGIELAEGSDHNKSVEDITTLQDARQSEVSFLDNVKYVDKCKSTSAGAVFIAKKFQKHCPEGTIPLITNEPYHCFAKSLFLFYPEANRSKTALIEDNDNRDLIHPSAEIEDNVAIEPGAVVGPEARIGSGTQISAGAVIGYRVYVGRDCYIGPNVTLTHSLLGDRVIVHAGASIGQDGFGFAIGAQGHMKVPQIGRVILQDDVDIGANTTIDRGALKDTIIGQGTKIDNLVQIGHNVVIGRNCIIVSQTGISGSTELEDFVFISGQCGLLGHLKVGAGAQLGAGSGLVESIPAGERWAGYPAQPIRTWMRQITTLKKLTLRRNMTKDAEN